MKRFAYILTFAMLIALSFTSCIDDHEYGTTIGPGTGETAELSFLVSTPPTTQVSTRGQTKSIQENTINNIYVLVFDKATGSLVAKSKGKDLAIASGAQDNNKITFKATLPVGTEYTFMVLANAEDKLTGIDVGMSKYKADVLNLTVNNTGKWDYTSSNIPMWAEKDLNLTASSTPSFNLVRMLARVNVEVNLRDINDVPPDNFVLTSVRYYNYNTVGALVPLRDNFATDMAMEPTLPADPETNSGNALIYDGSEIDNQMSCKEKIYIFEAAHNNNTYNHPDGNTDWIENPCLVIGGIYTTPDGTTLSETFYRVDFIKKDNFDPNATDIWLSVLRNYSYNVSIIEVNGSGFEDPDVALRSAPINMTANVLEWSEDGMGDIVFDGVFFLSVSRDKLSVVSSAVNEEREENVLYIKTDYTFNNDPDDSRSGWKAEYVDKDTGDPVYWLKLNPGEAPPDPDNPVKAYFTFEENDWEEPRTAIVWITAGRLRYPVEVTQQLAWVSIVTPGTDEPLSELSFVVPGGGISAQTKSFEVKWGPSSQSVAISWESPHNWIPFPPNLIDPDPDSDLSRTLTGTGSQIFEVNVPAVDASIIQQNPFYEKESVYSFTVGTGNDALTTSITLHQIHYNIAVDQYNLKLDGKRHNISVRSNTEWRIINVEEWLYNTPPTGTEDLPILLDLKGSDNLQRGTEGGPNLSGESLSFTVVNQDEAIHKDKWGTVYVTFESPDGKFDLVHVSIQFSPRSMTVLGIGSVLDVRGYNPAKSSPFHFVSLYQLLSNEYNFGNLNESVVKVNGLRFFAHNAVNLPTLPVNNATDEYDWRFGDMKKWMNKYKPDIILLSYAATINQDDSKLLKRYLENGGAIIMYYGGDIILSRIRFFFDEIFGRTFTYQDAMPNANNNDIIDRYDYPGTGSVFKLENIDDPILNGPFGDIRENFWGTHYRRVGIKSSLIQDKVHILSRTDSEQNSTRPGNYKTDPGYINMFRHKDYNLFWVGNGMGTATYYSYWNSREYWHDPNLVNEDGTPAMRLEFGSVGANTRYSVCGSYIYANAMAWAISATQYTHPTEGY